MWRENDESFNLSPHISGHLWQCILNIEVWLIHRFLLRLLSNQNHHHHPLYFLNGTEMCLNMLEENFQRSLFFAAVFVVLSFGEPCYTRTPEFRTVRTNHGNPFWFASSLALVFFFSALKHWELCAKRKVVLNAGTISLEVFWEGKDDLV